MSFSENLQTIRKKNQMSQEELAEKLEAVNDLQMRGVEMKNQKHRVNFNTVFFYSAKEIKP